MGDKFEIIQEIKNNNFERFKALIDQFDDLDDFALIKYDFNPELYSNKKDSEDPEDIIKSGISLLHVSAYYNSLQCFQYLLKEKQMPLRHLSTRNLLPLHYALYSGSKDVSLYILKEDPEESILHPEKDKEFSLLFCAVLGSDTTVVEELFKNCSKLNDPWNDESRIISKAIGRNYTDLVSLLWKQHNPLNNDEKNTGTYAMKCVINRNVNSLELIYDKNYDLDKFFIDRSGYHNLISLIAETDVRKIFKNFYLKILDDVKEMTIEPPEEYGYNAGVCHWCCLYNDLDVAKKMLNTKNIKINRFDKEKKTGAFKLVEKKENVPEMLELLINEGFDINLRYDETFPTLLESFLCGISKNYLAIEVLIKYGADINANHSRKKDRQGNKMTLAQFVKEGYDRKLKILFDNAEI